MNEIIYISLIVLLILLVFVFDYSNSVYRKKLKDELSKIEKKAMDRLNENTIRSMNNFQAERERSNRYTDSQIKQLIELFVSIDKRIKVELGKSLYTPTTMANSIFGTIVVNAKHINYEYHDVNFISQKELDDLLKDCIEISPLSLKKEVEFIKVSILKDDLDVVTSYYVDVKNPGVEKLKEEKKEK